MPMFKNAASSLGSGYTGQTWDVAWGDVDSDGYPDLWVSKHNAYAFVPGAQAVSLFLNDQSGRFTNATPQRVDYLQKDFHGAAWADFDNDGDLDIAQLSGGSSKGGVTLFENFGGTLQDQSAAHDLDMFNTAPGRNTLAWDYNNDGRLDLYLGAEQASTGGSPGTGPIILRQTQSGTFVDARQEVGFTLANAVSPMLSDLSSDGRPELILTHYGAISRIFDTTGTTFANVTSRHLGGVSIPRFDDIVIADFNNDLRPDIYLTRVGFSDEVALSGQQQIRSFISTVAAGEEKGFTFSTPGTLSFSFSKQDGSMNYSLIRVGSAGWNPITVASQPSFQLSSSDPANFGIAPHNSTDPGIYIGYDSSAAKWQYVVVGNAKASRGVLVDSTAPISNLKAQGFLLFPAPAQDQLLINSASGFVDRSEASGIAAMKIYGNQATTGDFDNDGDIDIVVDQASPALNRPNLLLENQGGGTFVRVANSGAGGTSKGAGGALATADYDRDGFLDIVSANGGGEPPFNPLNDGPLQLFRNLGNDNHWLAVRLHGSQSNADGIGAKVIVTAGGQQQMREAANGQHIKGQDFQDLHFGLGQNGTVDRLVVEWPSGARTVLDNLLVDELLEIDEGQGAASAVTPGQLDWLFAATDWTDALVANGHGDDPLALQQPLPADMAAAGMEADVALLLLQEPGELDGVGASTPLADTGVGGSGDGDDADVAVGGMAGAVVWVGGDALLG